ncbi:unnamed protein product, partial [Nesidiocoris tenuis]
MEVIKRGISTYSHHAISAWRPSVGLYIHGGTCPILQASRHQWQAGRPTQHSTGTFLAVVCELYCTAFSSTFGTLTDFYSGIISSALSTEPVKCANLALENNFLFSLNYPLLSCGALRIVAEIKDVYNRSHVRHCVEDDGQWRPELDGSAWGSGLLQWGLEDGSWKPHLDGSVLGDGHLTWLSRKRRSLAIVNPNALATPLDEPITALAKNAQLIQQHTEGT